MKPKETGRYWCPKVNDIIFHTAGEVDLCCDKPDRHMPALASWLDPYRRLICNTGGNVIEDLLYDLEHSQNLLTVNTPRYVLAAAVQSQVLLLSRLRMTGHLVGQSILAMDERNGDGNTQHE